MIPLLVLSNFPVDPPLKMILGLLLCADFTVAEITHLLSVFDLLHLGEKYIAVKVGFLSLGGAKKHVACTALVLVRLPTFRALLFRLAAQRDIPRCSQTRYLSDACSRRGRRERTLAVVNDEDCSEG